MEHQLDRATEPVALPRWLTRHKYQFHDTELSGSVEHACHALAIDERRAPFKPALWHLQPKPGQTVEQVWFPGVHSNVGGGYPDRGLADIALNWMIGKAGESGLAFNGAVEETLGLEPDPLGKLYDSKTGLYRLTAGHDRVIGRSVKHVRDGDDGPGQEDPTQSVHPSALERWEQDEGYRPTGLREYRERDRKGL